MRFFRFRNITLATLLLLRGFSAFGNQVVILNEPGQALQAHLDLIRKAKQEIDLSFFIWRDDTVGRALLAELRSAARRGVRVRIVVDALANLVPPATLQHLAHEGIELREYNRGSLMHFNPWARRLHDKVLVVDATHLIASDMNIGDEYFGLLEKPTMSIEGEVRPMRSRGLYVKGKSARQAWHYFEFDLWPDRYVAPAPIPQKIAPAELARAAHELDEAIPALQKKGSHLLEHADSWDASRFEAEGISFVHDVVGKRKGNDPGLEKAIFAVIEGARKRIDIQSPYLALTDRMEKALREAVSRGVRVRILTNSTRSSDNQHMSNVYEWKKNALSRMGLEIWEFDDPRTIHVKSLIADEKTAYLGSFNIHPRSELSDIETGLKMRNRRIARELLSHMDQDLRSARLVAKDGKLVQTLDSRCQPGVLRKVLYGLLWNQL